MPSPEWIVQPHEHRLRLDDFLCGYFPGLSRTRLRRAVHEGEVRVNGEVRTAGQRINVGDRVTAPLDPEEATALTPEALPLDILFEDEQLIVVNKAAGMVVHPAGRNRSGTLVNALAHHFNVLHGATPAIRPGLAHRLDRATSGVMVIAKTQRALSRLTVAFQQKRVEKRYLALVHGSVAAEAGTWEAPIGNDPAARPAWGVRASGRPAVTRYEIRQRTTARTLLELEPVTGRTNQLRLHCAHFGHPMVGDALFGDAASESPPCPRLFLHAYRLAFPHPSSHEMLVFETELPAVLAHHLAACS